jgi:GT2 family glycosyltransferase
MDIINTFCFPIIRQDQILPALASLREHTPPNYRTIVVNQTVPNREFEEALYDACDYIIRPHWNLGFAQAANLGMRLAPTPYVTVSNDDIIFLAGWFEGIEKSFAMFPRAIAIGPMSPKEPGWGYNEPGYREHLTLEESQVPANIQQQIEKWHGSVIDGLAMFLVVFKRKEWQEIGMFDERFVPGGGEDYCALFRIYKRGWRALSTSYSWVYHHWGQSKDMKDGFDTALPLARPRWNKLSTKCDPDEGLYDPDCCIWATKGTRTDPNVYRASL